MTQDGAGSIHALRDESDPWSVFDPLCTSACTIARIDSSALTVVSSRAYADEFVAIPVFEHDEWRRRSCSACRPKATVWIGSPPTRSGSLRMSDSERSAHASGQRPCVSGALVEARDRTTRRNASCSGAHAASVATGGAQCRGAHRAGADHLATSLSGAQKLRGPERSRASRRRSAVNPIRARIERIAPTGRTYLNRAIQTMIAHGTAPQASEYGAGVPVEYQFAAIAQAVTSPGTKRASQATATRPSHLLRLTPVSLPRGDVRTRQPN